MYLNFRDSNVEVGGGSCSEVWVPELHRQVSLVSFAMNNRLMPSEIYRRQLQAYSTVTGCGKTLRLRELQLLVTGSPLFSFRLSYF